MNNLFVDRVLDTVFGHISRVPEKRPSEGDLGKLSDLFHIGSDKSAGCRHPFAHAGETALSESQKLLIPQLLRELRWIRPCNGSS